MESRDVERMLFEEVRGTAFARLRQFNRPSFSTRQYAAIYADICSKRARVDFDPIADSLARSHLEDAQDQGLVEETDADTWVLGDVLGD